MENKEENDKRKPKIVVDIDIMSDIIYDSFIENYGKEEIDGILIFLGKTKTDLSDSNFQKQIHEMFKVK